MKTEENKLPPDFKKKWIEKLRSGEYEQTECALFTTLDPDNGKPRMCCLGVACDIAGVPREKMHAIAMPSDLDGVENIDKLPITLRSTSMFVGDLASMNDNGDSFDAIADYIETHC